MKKSRDSQTQNTPHLLVLVVGAEVEGELEAEDLGEGALVRHIQREQGDEEVVLGAGESGVMHQVGQVSRDMYQVSGARYQVEVQTLQWYDLSNLYILVQVQVTWAKEWRGRCPAWGEGESLERRRRGSFLWCPGEGRCEGRGAEV